MKLQYTYLPLLTIIVCLLSSCKKAYQEKLTNVENLIEADKIDSAYTTIEAIRYDNLTSEEDKALYGLLKTRVIAVKENSSPNDSLVNKSLAYYQDKDNKGRIADCLFYKAKYEYYCGKVSSALNHMYNAERYANQTDNTSLKHKICETLIIWNNTLSQYNVAQHYGELNLKISKEADNKNWLAYAYLFLAYTYQHQQKEQLSKDCIHKALKNIDYVKKFDRAEFYLTLGNFQEESNASEDYYRKALQTCPTPNIYSALCSAEYANGNIEVADSFLRKVNEGGTLDLRIYTYANLVSIAEKQSDYEQVYKYLKPKDSLLVEKHQQELDNNGLQIYKEYNYKMEQLKFWQIITYVVYAISIAVVLVLFYLIIQRLRHNKNLARAFENQLLINIVEEKLRRLRHADKDNSKQAEKKKLEKSLIEYKGRLSQVVGEGKQLYQDIMDGGNTQKWGKSDYENYIEYYKLIDLPFILQIESNYTRLSPRNIFYLILNKEGKSEEEIRRIMVLTLGSYRTMRTRIKDKKLIN